MIVLAIQDELFVQDSHLPSTRNLWHL